MTTAGGVVPAQSITAALRDLYSSMEKGSTVHPIVLLQVLHLAFPRFAEKSDHGSFAQQVSSFSHCTITDCMPFCRKSMLDAPRKTVISKMFQPAACLVS